MTKIEVTAHPYATMFGSLDVPDKVVNGSDEKLREYICDHWDEIDFGKPILAFQGCDYDYDYEFD